MVTRTLTNLTPAQLEEFESSFRYFDRDGINALDEIQFEACLASHGHVGSDETFANTFKSACNGASRVDFESFIKFMIGITEDRTNPGQLREAFKNAAGEKV